MSDVSQSNLNVKVTLSNAIKTVFTPGEQAILGLIVQNEYRNMASIKVLSLMHEEKPAVVTDEMQVALAKACETWFATLLPGISVSR